MKIGVIIQARTGSTRLPAKVLKQLCGKTVLAHDIERVSQSTLVDEIIIATTVGVSDDAIEKEALTLGVKVFRGSEEDVLSRYYYAAKANDLDVVVRITSDCPLIDPKVIDEMLAFYLDNEYDLVTNAGADLSQRTYPRGLDTEIFAFSSLEKAFLHAKEQYQREHVTPYIYENSKIYYYKNDSDCSHYRITLDTEEDFQLISAIYVELYKGTHDFYLSEVVDLLNKKPELVAINAHIEQKKIK